MDNISDNFTILKERISQALELIDALYTADSQNKVLLFLHDYDQTNLDLIGTFLQVMYYGNVSNDNVEEGVKALILGVRAAFLYGYTKGRVDNSSYRFTPTLSPIQKEVA